MAIFQKSVIQKQFIYLDKEQLGSAYQTFKANFTPAKIEKIKELKEEEYQDGFLRDLFVDVLGYTLKPDDNYNLVREFKNIDDAKKTDGAILKDGNAIAVIELKSTKTKELKNVTQQAFNYKNNQPNCKYVITSNFQKLRFYIDFANEFEEFDLFNMTKKEFDLLYLVLSKNSIFNDTPLELKKETIFHEENVSKQLYKDYSAFKNKLFDNLIKNNSEYDKLTLFKKSQKLIDRFLFILFAEDRGLLPPNSINRIIQRFNLLKDEDAYKPLYDIYKQYFGYMNIGRKGKSYDDDIPAYNGGLFYPDDALDNLKIDDYILIDDLKKLSAYDFNTEVDVNILGHIFEHSLSEIEEITAEIEGTTADKTKSKRKKDGVFYTPKYITQYIVENTIGKLCKEKRKELGIEEIEFDISYKTKSEKLTAKGEKLYKTLKDYKSWLLTLKILDPACGSGAFLNQALNFLIEEHKTIDDIIAELTSTPLRLFDTNKAILENNLYGVDINEESVEIAKLSLWLRTAVKGRKLSNLNNNIKCGNSLIDDPEVAGDKAFDWHKEFPQIFKVKTKKSESKEIITKPDYLSLIEKQSKLAAEKAAKAAKLSNEAIKHSEKIYEYAQLQGRVAENYGEYNVPEGGFDVVIGNPPYVHLNTLSKKDKDYYTKKWISAFKQYDLYVLFYELGLKLLKTKGLLSFITPNKFYVADYGKKCRKYILENSSIIEIADISTMNIFPDASVYPTIITCKKHINFKNYINIKIKLKNPNELIQKKYEKIKQTIFINENDNIINLNVSNRNLTNKIDNAGIPIGKLFKITRGFRPPKQELITKNKTEGAYRLLIGSALNKAYNVNWDGNFVIYKQKEIPEAKPINIFLQPKILIRDIGLKFNAYFDDNNFLCLKTIYFIFGGENNDLKFVTTILNSKLLNFYFFEKYSSMHIAGGYLRFRKQFIEKIPIKIIKKQQPFIEKADKMLELNKQLQKKKNKFLNRVRDNFDFEKILKN